MTIPLPPCPDTTYTNETVPGTSVTPEAIPTETYSAETQSPQLIVVASNCVNEEVLSPYIIYNGLYLYNDSILYDGVTVI